jgi:hypothetical protein
MRAREEVAHVRVICARIYTSLARTLPRGSGIRARDCKMTFGESYRHSIFWTP